jgi:hypothetical protein
VPPPLTEESLQATCTEDWSRDSSRRTGVEGEDLGFKQFHEAWFELADFWVDVVDRQRYVDFVAMCYNGVTKWSDLKGEEDVRVFKSDAECVYNPSFFGDESEKLDDKFYEGHSAGKASLTDLPGLFNGNWNFRQVAPYSLQRCGEFILDIYEYERARHMRAHHMNLAELRSACRRARQCFWRS